MTKIEKVKERVAAIMSALREFTAECRLVEEEFSSGDCEDDVVKQVVGDMCGLNVSLCTMVSRVNELSLLLQDEEGSPGQCWPSSPFAAPMWPMRPMR